MKISKKFWKLRAAANNTAELLLYGPISETTWCGDEITPKQFADDLKALGDIQELVVRINSGGGDVFAGQTIYSLLKTHPATVTVRIDGLAASIASVIAMAGDTVVMPKNAMIMIHNPWTLALGDAQEFREIADFLDKVRDTIIAAYEAKTGLDRDKLIELMDAETWLNASEALELGFVDSVDHTQQIAASLRSSKLIVNGHEFDVSRFKSLPETLMKGAQDMDLNMDLTVETLAEKYPQLYEKIRNSAYEEGKAAGVKAERERFKALQELEAPGCEEILNRARYETGETAEEVAMEVVKALKKQGVDMVASLQNDAAVLTEVHSAPIPSQDEESERSSLANAIAASANKRRGVMLSD